MHLGTSRCKSAGFWNRLDTVDVIFFYIKKWLVFALGRFEAPAASGPRVLCWEQVLSRVVTRDALFTVTPVNLELLANSWAVGGFTASSAWGRL